MNGDNSKRLLLALLLVAHCEKPVNLEQEEARYEAYIAALPELKEVPRGSKIVLTVHYVERSQLPALDTGQRENLYRLTEKLIQKTFGYDLKIEETVVYRSKDFLKAVAPRFKASPQRYPALAYLISFFAADRDARVLQAVKAALAKHAPERVAQYLGVNNTPELAAQFFLKRLGEIYGESDFSGKPILSAANREEEVLYSYGHWSSILQGERDADFILTNTGIIGADTGMPLYVIARGGVTSAFVENNAFRPYQGAGVIGLYPFLSDGAVFRAVRGDLSFEQKLETIAWIWVHELGHLLLKKEENYTFEDSVHRTAPDLNYYAWVKRVKASRNHHTHEIPRMKKF